MENRFSMKQIIHNLQPKQYITFIFICFFSLAIWFYGPTLIIANQSPLAQVEKRLYIIALIFLSWILHFVLTLPKTPMHTLPKTKNLSKKFLALEGRFQGAIRFLKNTFITKQGKNVSLLHLPWYLLIGPHNSGKTSLLAHAGLNFILSKKFPQEKIKASDSCDWWVTRDLVLVDTPGSYITKTKTRSSLENNLWETLLNLTMKFRPKNSIQGIVIALPLPELIKDKNTELKKQLIADIKYQINYLISKFGNTLSFYFVITKCDLIPGFQEFFSESSADELTQAWGITLSPKENENMADIFMNRFNALIKRLNNQLISRLHQERNPNARPLIKDFPLQVEHLKESTANFLKALAMPHLNLHGIYLTSAVQHTTEETYSQPQLINPTTTLQLLRSPISPIKSYFIRQFISHGLLSSAQVVNSSPTQKSIWLPRMVYTGAISSVIIASILLGQDFQQGIQQSYLIQNNLAQYQLSIQQSNQTGDGLLKALPLLNSLYTAANRSHSNLSRLENLLSFYSDKSQQTASTVYVRALQTIVIPEIKIYLEKYLQTTHEKNPLQLYAVLKAYLMLSDKSHLQVDYIVSMVKKLTPNTLNQQASTDLINHITIAFSQPATAVELNPQLVEEVRKQLRSLSNLELAWIILKNTNNNNIDSSIHLGTNIGNQPVFVSKEIADQIPNMFTANAFQSILTNEITTASMESLQGNWIIGSSPILSNEATITELAEQVRSKYISNYIDIWESLLANLKLVAPQSLAEAHAMTANLMSNTSPLLQMLQTVKENTAFDLIINTSPKLQALNALLTNINNNQENGLYQIFVSLRQLHLYLDGIVKTSNVGNAAFTAATLRMQDPSADPITALHSLADLNPEPMKTWLHNLALQSWSLILQEAGHHVENAWQTNVMSIYHAQLANRFPFKLNAPREVSLQQFTYFLNPQGTLMNFYQAFLKPFIYENNNTWQWRTVDNQKMPFSEGIFDQIQFAMKLQKVFFPNGDNKLFIPFTVQRVNLDKELKSIRFDINGQQILDEQIAERIPHTLSWPGNNGGHATSLTLTSGNSTPLTHTIKGDWAWFRLINSSSPTIISPKQVALNLNMNGHHAKYMLFTQGHINPFMQLNLEKFKLPEQL